jgi:hypothetical protein
MGDTLVPAGYLPLCVAPANFNVAAVGRPPQFFRGLEMRLSAGEPLRRFWKFRSGLASREKNKEKALSSYRGNFHANAYLRIISGALVRTNILKLAGFL